LAPDYFLVLALNFTVGRPDLLTIRALLRRLRRSIFASGENCVPTNRPTMMRKKAPRIKAIGLSKFMLLFAEKNGDL